MESADPFCERCAQVRAILSTGPNCGERAGSRNVGALHEPLAIRPICACATDKVGDEPSAGDKGAKSNAPCHAHKAADDHNTAGDLEDLPLLVRLLYRLNGRCQWARALRACLRLI